MELTTNSISSLTLDGHIWVELLDKMKGDYFSSYYEFYIFCVSIGIACDTIFDMEKNVLANDYDVDKFPTIPNSMIYKNLIEINNLYSISIISTNKINMSLDERLELAFSENNDSNKKIKFLTGFANYGAKRVYDIYDEEELTFMNNLNDMVSEIGGLHLLENNLNEEDYDLIEM